MVKVYIYGNLQPDKRYHDVMKDIKRNSGWGNVRIRHALETAAAAEGDLLSSIATEATPPRQRIVNVTKGNRQQRQAAANAAANGVEDEEESVRMKRIVLAAVSAVTASLATKAHPNGGAKGNKKAEGAKLTPAELEIRKKEPCLHFQKGSCRYGDSCTRNHVKLSDEDAEALEAAVGKRAGARADNNDEGICYLFAANGICSYGDTCKFTHGDAATVCMTNAQVGDSEAVVEGSERDRDNYSANAIFDTVPTPLSQGRVASSPTW